MRGVSFEVAPGEIVGLIGANGAGKSSTLHAIMGVVAPAAGDVRLGGVSLRGKAPEDVARSGIALVPEGRRIFGELTVEENLRLGLAARRSRGPADEDAPAASTSCSRSSRSSGAATRARSRAASSSSSRSRARSSREPDVLLLDEPSLGLAPTVVDVVFEALAAIRERGDRGPARRAARAAHRRARRPLPRARERRAAPDARPRGRGRHRQARGGVLLMTLAILNVDWQTLADAIGRSARSTR